GGGRRARARRSRGQVLGGALAAAARDEPHPAGPVAVWGVGGVDPGARPPRRRPQVFGLRAGAHGPGARGGLVRAAAARRPSLRSQRGGARGQVGPAGHLDVLRGPRLQQRGAQGCLPRARGGGGLGRVPGGQGRGLGPGAAHEPVFGAGAEAGDEGPRPRGLGARGPRVFALAARGPRGGREPRVQPQGGRRGRRRRRSRAHHELWHGDFFGQGRRRAERGRGAASPGLGPAGAAPHGRGALGAVRGADAGGRGGQGGQEGALERQGPGPRE
ncbi:hypothetical protein H632_c4443p0, partial [Helicosporidium sp. ATCC 50920]